MFKIPGTPLGSSEIDMLVGSQRIDDLAYGGDWGTATEKYLEAWDYYSGNVFNQTSARDPNTPLFPLGVNVVALTCRMHALFLWGQYQRSRIVTLAPVTDVQKRTQPTIAPPNPAAPPKPVMDPEIETQRDQGAVMTRFFDKFLRANHGNTLFREQGRIFTTFGGTYFKLRYDPLNRFGISIDAPAPMHVFPAYHPMDYRRFIRMHLKVPINAQVAEYLYNYKAHGSVSTVEYRETWQEDAYVVTINGSLAYDRATKQPLAGRIGLVDPLTGERLMPWIYIPRLRAGAFYGAPLPTELAALQDEINTRLADMGDAVTMATHGERWGHDLTRRRGKEPLSFTPGEILDAGDTAPGGAEPFIGALPPPDISAGIADFSSKLLDRAKELAQLTPVTFGVDEGSQRSAETLNTRAVPTTLLIDDYRAYWGEGLSRLYELAVLMSVNAGINEADPTWLERNWEIEFASILPKDRVAVVQEVITRFTAGLISKRRALELLPDVPDVEAELASIEADAEIQRQRDQVQADQEHQRAVELTEKNAAARAKSTPPPSKKES